MPTVRCPACRGEVTIHPDDFGHAVSCPLCRDVFTPRDESEEGNRSTRDELDDEDRAPRRRRGYEPDAEAARRAVSAPANGLIWTGIIGALLNVLAGLGMVGLGIFLFDDPTAAPEDPWILIVVGAAYGGVGVPYFLVIAAGGRQLKRLDGGTGLVYAAGIMGIATVALCGICWPPTWAGVGFGIWALVALNKAEVRDVLMDARGE